MLQHDSAGYTAANLVARLVMAGRFCAVYSLVGLWL
jgi:hypothetical protein